MNRMVLILLALATTAALASSRHASARPEAPNPLCAAERVAEARTAFKAAYGAGKFADAGGALEEIWSDCAAADHHQLPPQTAGEIANDLAIADHRAGDDRECLEALMDYWPDDRQPAPAFQRLSPALQKAMRFNWRLCRPACAGGGLSSVDAICTSLEINDDQERLEPGFRARPCSLRAGASAVALGDGTCLVILPPKKSYDPSTVDSADRRDICPTPALISKVGGRTMVTRLKAPDKSFLNSPQFCCHPVTLGVDGAGRIAAAPGEDAIEGCVSGHYPGTMQDIFRLQNGRLVMVKQLQEPWFPTE